MRRRAAAPLTLVLLLVATARPSDAFRAPDGEVPLADFDARVAPGPRLAAALALRAGTDPSALAVGPDADPGPVRRRALAGLERAAGVALAVRWDRVTGSPAWLVPRRGFLTKPDGRSPEAVARDFVLRHRDLWLLSASDAAALRVDAVVPLASGGAVVWLAQRRDGLPVLHGHLAVGVSARGRVLHAAGAGVTGAGELPSSVAKHRPGQALVVLAGMAGVALEAEPEPTREAGDEAWFDVPELRGETRVSLVVLPTRWGPRLGWEADVAVAGAAAWHDVAVEDVALQPVRRSSRTWYADTRGRVFRQHPGVSPHEIERFVDAEDFRSDLSPLGWAWTDLTEGNNCTVRDDRAADDEATLGAQAQAAPAPPYLAFDFPFTDGGDADLDAALTSLFYGINLSHDRFYELGFDESSGNFQVDNRSLGGVGADPVLGDAQDGSGTNNANFQTPPDGFPGRMQMFVWDASGQRRSSSFDLGVVVHEYVHGVSTRLVGGPNSVACLFGPQGASMGEGWSDFFPASFFDDPVIGEWVAGDPNGIRMFRLDDNPPMGKDYRDFCTYGTDFPPTFCEPHDNGEIWSGFLWTLREAYEAAYGPAGVEEVERLVVDGLKLTPCSPSMLDARDALILADRAATGGVNECLIKQAARGRWMGFSASSMGGSDTEPVAADDAWPECGSEGLVRFTRRDLELGAPATAYSCADEVQVAVVDGNAAAPLSVIVRGAGGDLETLDLAAAPQPGVFLGSLPTDDTALPNPGDLVLQVVDGETLTVEYVDLDDPGAVLTDEAVVACAARLTVARHRIHATTCDDDEVAGYPALPGFLDAGEAADLDLFIANHMPVDVQGSVVVTTDRPDLITVLPSAPIPVSLRAAVGADVPETRVTVRVVAMDTVMTGDTANVEVRLMAPGFDPAVAYTLPLALHLDYELVPGLTVADDIEAEVGGPVGAAWSTGTTQAGGNEWTLVTCANTTPAGTQAYRNGPDDCMGDYTDDQGAPYLASPTLDLALPNTVAARLTNVTWMHDIDLGSDGNPLFGIPEVFDADAVGVLVTNDPPGVDTTDPFSLVEQALSFYAQLEPLGITSNTTGWEPESIDVDPRTLAGVDLLQPAWIAWYMVTDVTPSSFPPLTFSAQGEGYYLDDLVVTYERVDAIPDADACMAGVVPFAFPLVTAPAAGAACAGDVVTIDASLSEAANCGPPADLEYRFLVAGSPVACWDDAGGMTPRPQDADGWGPGPTCHDFPTADTTYEVEVRCAADPSTTDLRSVTVRVLDGTALLSVTPPALCATGSDPVLLDAASSVLVGCDGDIEYHFEDPAGVPLDCDGDGDLMDEGFGPEPTCQLGPAAADVEVVVRLRCSTVPGCTIDASFTVPAIRLTPDLALVDPGGAPFCPGSPVEVTAAGTVMEGCLGGTLEFTFTPSEGTPVGPTTDPVAGFTFTQDGEVALEVRCDLDPTCTDVLAMPLAIDVRDGTVEVESDAAPDACVGEDHVLTATHAVAIEACAAVEYRFWRGAEMLDCTGDGVPDDWGAARTCDTILVDDGQDYAVEARCVDDPSCVYRSADLTVPFRTGVPVGTTVGTLLVTKTVGCPAGVADVLLDWPDTDLVPQAFVVTRRDEEVLDPVAHRLSDVDGVSHADVGAACDGAGAPYRGVAIWFYQVFARNGCTGDVIP